MSSSSLLAVLVALTCRNQGEDVALTAAPPLPRLTICQEGNALMNNATVYRMEVFWIEWVKVPMSWCEKD
ncbi:hypothetical protein TNIN_278831 [Trichonephila inaurata madagascariensis]|uniref:Secreted protein n=1 Tax=Trichonephila inaurata madagascariensis TaxID=2747483 RepID=A0A8X6Y1V4_9ARAC|nr:hypothetical protein TNIN_278831 [Trichonephila inaurata madagascariensis]